MMATPLNREELAWAAGFFDGEGSTSLQRSPKQYTSPTLVVSIGQVGRESLDRFRDAVGAGRVYEVKTVPGAFAYRVSSFSQAQAVIALLWGFWCGPKRAQAAKALEGYRDAPARRRPMTGRWH